MELIKKYIAVILVFAAVLTFVSCAKDGKSSSEQIVMPAYVENGVPEKMKETSRLVEGNKARLAKVFKKARQGKPITVAFLGGSITQGVSAGYEYCYATLTTRWLQQTFPKSEITGLNYGIGATGSYIGVGRVDRHVLAAKPDLVFVEFSVNDSKDNTKRNVEAYTGIMKKLWYADSSPAVVAIAMTMENGTSFQEYHNAICSENDIPMISYHDAVLEAIDNNNLAWSDVADDVIHPNIVGHAILTELITSYLQDVLDNMDTIDITDEPADIVGSDKYVTASIVVPTDNQKIEGKGWEIISDNQFFGFGSYWRTESKDGSFKDVEPLKFEVEAKSIGIIFGMMVQNGGKFDVVVDGKTVTTIDSHFKKGWGNYPEAEEVVEFNECSHHTLEIVPCAGQETAVTVLAFLLTK